MLRRGIAIAIAISGIAFVARGWSISTDHKAARHAAVAFLEAVRDGDAVRARHMMDGALATGDLEWSTDPGTRITVLEVRPDGPEMVAEAEVERSGYTLLPTLHLRQSKDGTWRVARISDLGVDRDWVDQYEESLLAQDRALTTELRVRIGSFRRELRHR